MNYSWRQTVFPIASIFSFRLLGLFMLIPIFTTYAPGLTNATPALIGLALGSYGLSQGILQIPFGMLSDRLGRKTMITIGLILFAVGSLMGAWAHTIHMMILARALQGAGAVGSVLMALLADLTPDNQRTKAMAVVGISIGFSFSLAMIISPAIAEFSGLAGIFYFTALLAVIALLLLHLVIPTPVKDPFHAQETIQLHAFKQVFTNNHLLRLNASIFFQHLILTSTFYVLPMMLQEQIRQGHLSEAWHFYLILMLGAFILMLPIIAIAERRHRLKVVFMLAVILSTASQFTLIFLNQSWISISIAMMVYFIAFNILEASLPSQVSRHAPLATKGTAMGIYSSSQFLGIFAGGALAGILFQQAGNTGIFMMNAVISLIWAFMTTFMKPNAYELTLTIPLAPELQHYPTLQEALNQLPGVCSVSIALDQHCIHLRVAKEKYIHGSAENCLRQLITTHFG